MKESVIGVCAEWHRRRGAAQLVTQRKDCAAAALRSVSGILYRLVVPPLSTTTPRLGPARDLYSALVIQTDTLGKRISEKRAVFRAATPLIFDGVR